MSDYPEHEKQAKILDQSQAIGNFLEWLTQERGVRLMRWAEWDQEEESERISDGSPYTFTAHYAEYVPLRESITDLLASYFEIDLKKLDDEKRAMLAALRAHST